MVPADRRPMRPGRPWAVRLLLLLVVLAVPAGQAIPFTPDLRFADVGADPSVPVLAGALQVSASAGGAPTVLVNVTGFELVGLQVVCWSYPCQRSDAADLSVRVLAGSTVALRFPRTGTLHLLADHAVASPVGLDGSRAGFGELAAGVTFAPSVAASTRGGSLTFRPESLPPDQGGRVPAQQPIPGLPPAVASQFQAPDPDDANSAVLAGLTPDSALQVRQGNQLLRELRGQAGLLLQGQVRASEPIAAAMFVLPCADGCDLTVRAAGAGANVLGAVQDIVALAAALNGGTVPSFELGALSGLVDPLADGAYLELPMLAAPGDFRASNLTLVRFDVLQARLAPASPMATGDGDLVIQSGDIEGAPTFVGGRYFGMPLWSYLLWAAAVVLLVLRLALRRDSEDWRDAGRTWPRVLGLLAFAVLLVVWHLAFDRILGLSATTPGLDPAARGLVAAIELATLALLAVMVVLPARILGRNLLRLVGLPGAARFAGTAALAAGAVLAPLLLLGILDLVLGMFP